MEIHTNEDSGDGAALERKTKEKETRLEGFQRGLISKAKTDWKCFLAGTTNRSQGGHQARRGDKPEAKLRVNALFNKNKEAQPSENSQRADAFSFTVNWVR